MIARGRPPCDHRRLAGEKYLGADTGADACLDCGRELPRSRTQHRRRTALPKADRPRSSGDVAYVAQWSASGSSLRESRVTGHPRANPCTHLVDLDRDLRPNARQSSDTQRSDPGSRQRERRTALSMSPSGRHPRLAIANVTEITATARVLYSAYQLS